MTKERRPKSYDMHKLEKEELFLKKMDKIIFLLKILLILGSALIVTIKHS